MADPDSYDPIYFTTVLYQTENFHWIFLSNKQLLYEVVFLLKPIKICEYWGKVGTGGGYHTFLLVLEWIRGCGSIFLKKFLFENPLIIITRYCAVVDWCLFNTLFLSFASNSGTYYFPSVFNFDLFKSAFILFLTPLMFFLSLVFSSSRFRHQRDALSTYHDHQTRRRPSTWRPTKLTDHADQHNQCCGAGYIVYCGRCWFEGLAPA